MLLEMLSGQAKDKYESVESHQQNMAINTTNYSISQFNPMMAAIGLVEIRPKSSF